jgi:CubicO group peptidase (beta-lactamase class C family)
LVEFSMNRFQCKPYAIDADRSSGVKSAELPDFDNGSVGAWLMMALPLPLTCEWRPSGAQAGEVMMKPSDVMKGAPPSAEALVTRFNWRKYPYSQWSFRNVRQVLPTADIRRGATLAPMTAAFRDLGALGFSYDGTPTTVAETLKQTYADGLLVMHRGQIVTEWYGEGMTPHTPHLVCSVSKSICGTLGGVLVERGLLDVDKPVTDYVPEAASSVYGGCTVRNLLDMTVAITFDEDYDDPDGDVVKYRLCNGWDVLPNGTAQGDQRSFLTTLRPNGAPHGKVFHYVSTNTDMLGWVYERACGKPYAQILSEYVWAPMGAQDDAYITLDTHGASRSAGGICATLRDLGRFGEMIRKRGLAGGAQVVPGWWIDDIHHNGDLQAFADGDLAFVFPGGRYRSCWYSVDIARNDLAAVGIHGQWILIDPTTDTVIVKVASQPNPMDIPIDYRWLAAFRAIGAYLSDTLD